jgi:type I restriction enzyme S subunit
MGRKQAPERRRALSNDLPEGWIEVQLAEVTLRVESVKPDARPNREFGYVDISAVDRHAGKIVPAGLRRFLGKNAPSRARRPISPGDVLFSNVRTNLRNIALVEPGLPAELCSTGFTVLRPGPAVLPHYLLRWVLTDGFTNEISETQTGTHYPATSDAQVLSQRVRIPPLAEQRRIVEKVEALLERVNRAKARLDRVRLILNRFRQAVLAAACSGELTRGWRERHADGVRGCREPSVGDGETQDDIERPELPAGWAWKPLGQVAEFVNGDRSKRYPNRKEYVASGLPFINTGHIEPDGSLALVRMNYITRDKWRSLTGGKIERGDLLYCLRGATLGKTALVEPFTEGAIASSLVIIRPSVAVRKNYLYLFLVSPLARQEIKLYDNGSAQPNLSAADVGKYLVPLPPREEQAEIVRNANGLFAIFDAVQRRVQAANLSAEKLAQAILSKAFSGELVPTEAELARTEHRSYESAEALLARLAGAIKPMSTSKGMRMTKRRQRKEVLE